MTHFKTHNFSLKNPVLFCLNNSRKNKQTTVYLHVMYLCLKIGCAYPSSFDSYNEPLGRSGKCHQYLRSATWVSLYPPLQTFVLMATVWPCIQSLPDIWILTHEILPDPAFFLLALNLFMLTLILTPLVSQTHLVQNVRFPSLTGPYKWEFWFETVCVGSPGSHGVLNPGSSFLPSLDSRPRAQGLRPSMTQEEIRQYKNKPKKS